MKKKTKAIIIELIPLFSAIVSFILIMINYDSELIRNIIKITILLSLLGFIFFFIGRKLEKDDKIVKILGILDFLAPLYVIVLYIVAALVFGL